jgi:transposase
MRILSLDLSKYKTVACDYEAETGRHQFVTVLTTRKALHDLIVDREPDRVVIEICSIAGWVCDLVRSLGHRRQGGHPSFRPRRAPGLTTKSLPNRPTTEIHFS